MTADELRPKLLAQAAGRVMHRLRHSRLAAVVAVLLLVLQVVATADHLGSLAFAAGSGQAGAGGFLDLCRSPRPAGAPSDATQPDAPAVCPACAIAASAAGGIVSLTPLLLTPVSFAVVAPAPIGVDLADPKPFTRYGATRGPPLA